MSINGIGLFQSLGQAQYASNSNVATTTETGGDVDRSRVSAPSSSLASGSSPTTGVSESLLQLGVIPAGSNVSTGDTLSSVKDALNGFLHDLGNAIAARTNSTTAGASDSTPVDQNFDAKGYPNMVPRQAVQAYSAYPAVSSQTSGIENSIHGLIQEVQGNSQAPDVIALRQSFQKLKEVHSSNSKAGANLADVLEHMAQILLNTRIKVALSVRLLERAESLTQIFDQ